MKEDHLHLPLCLVIAHSHQRIPFHHLFTSPQLLNNANTDTATPETSVSNYQDVFQQLKSENPTSSLGALQQMTMQRIAELKAQKEQEEAELEEERENEERRLKEEKRRLALANNALNKWVGKIRNVPAVTLTEGENDDGESDQDNVDTAATNQFTSQRQIQYKAHLDDSFSSSSTGIPERSKGSIAVLTQMMPNPLITHGRQNSLIRRRNANNNNNNNNSVRAAGANDKSSNNRQATLDSTSQTAANTASDNIVMGAIPRTAEEMYATTAEEQGANFAPRRMRSVGDFSVGTIDGDEFSQHHGQRNYADWDEKSVHSIISDMSGLFIDAKNDSGDGGSAVGSNVGSVIDLIFDHSQYPRKDDERGESKTEAMRLQQQHGNKHKVLNDRQQSIDSYVSDANVSESNRSNISDHTSLSRDSVNSNGLIVGFVKRRFSDSSGKGTDCARQSSFFNSKSGNGAFASDFSAWESRT